MSLGDKKDMTEEELELTRGNKPIENVDFRDKKFKVNLENSLSPLNHVNNLYIFNTC